MIRRYIGERLRRAATDLVIDRGLSRLLDGSPIGSHADTALRRSRQRYDRWRMVWTVLYGWEETR